MRLLLVKWVDSVEQHSWSYRDEWNEHAMSVISVGFLIAESDISITVAPHYGPKNEIQGLKEQACGIMTIPKVAVLSITELQMPRKKSASQKKISRAMKEVFTHKPRTATKKGGRKQLVAIALAKARKAGARVPRKKSGRKR